MQLEKRNFRFQIILFFFWKNNVIFLTNKKTLFFLTKKFNKYLQKKWNCKKKFKKNLFQEKLPSPKRTTCKRSISQKQRKIHRKSSNNKCRWMRYFHEVWNRYTEIIASNCLFTSAVKSADSSFWQNFIRIPCSMQRNLISCGKIQRKPTQSYALNSRSEWIVYVFIWRLTCQLTVCSSYFANVKQKMSRFV